jgi:hypothetical protein
LTSYPAISRLIQTISAMAASSSMTNMRGMGDVECRIVLGFRINIQKKNKDSVKDYKHVIKKRDSSSHTLRMICYFTISCSA